MLRWEDCVKRDVTKAGEEEDWKKKTRDRGRWKSQSDEAVKKLRTSPRPYIQGHNKWYSMEHRLALCSRLTK